MIFFVEKSKFCSRFASSNVEQVCVRQLPSLFNDICQLILSDEHTRYVAAKLLHHVILGLDEPQSKLPYVVYKVMSTDNKLFV